MNFKYLSSIETFQIIWNVWNGPENLPKFAFFLDLITNRIYENNLTNMAMEHVIGNKICNKMMCHMSIDGHG